MSTWIARKTHRKTRFLFLGGGLCPRTRKMFMYEPGPYCGGCLLGPVPTDGR